MGTKVRLSEAASEYVAWCRGRNLSKGATRSYATTLKQFVEAAGDPYCHDLNPQHVDRFFASGSWGTGTRNRKLTELQVFLKWLRARRYAAVDSDPIYGWRRERRTDGHTPLWIPIEDWGRLFAHCIHPTEKMTVALGLYLFLRGSEIGARERNHDGDWELFGIQIKHVRLNDSEIDVYRKKTRTWDALPIPAELDGHLRSYLTWLSKQVDGGLDPEMYLIPARNRDLATDPDTGRLVAGTGTVQPFKPVDKPHRIIQRVLGRCGFPTKGTGEHTLRRSGARAYFYELLEQGYDGALAQVSSMLGHESMKTTEIYLGLSFDRERRNSVLRGVPMFASLQADNVVSLRDDAVG